MKFDDILLALVLRRPITGYDAKKWLDTEGLFLRANADQSQIYRTLHRLERKKLIQRTCESRPGGPDANVYGATTAGAQQILDLARQPFEPRARWQEPDFSARLTMVTIFVPESIVPLLRTELEFRRAQVARFRHRPRRMEFDCGLVDFDPDTARELADAGHEIGSAGADQWIVWLENQLARWASRFPPDADAPTSAAKLAARNR